VSIVDPSLLPFSGVALLLAMTPGPDMATVTRAGLAHGRRGVVLTAFGIASALVLWILASALGVAALLAASAQLFTVVKLIGATYLAYLGVRTLIVTLRSAERQPENPPPPPGSHIFRTGFLSAGLNPKLGVFFVTLLPQFVQPGQPVLARLLLLGAMFMVIGITWVICYGLVVTRVRDVLASPRVKTWMERVTGVVLIGFAARLALERR
jgi:threonine/homoserine/homoserine lactone efflux protein